MPSRWGLWAGGSPGEGQLWLSSLGHRRTETPPQGPLRPCLHLSVVTRDSKCAPQPWQTAPVPASRVAVINMFIFHPAVREGGRGTWGAGLWPGSAPEGRAVAGGAWWGRSSVHDFVHRGLLVPRAGDDVPIVSGDVAAEDGGGLLGLWGRGTERGGGGAAERSHRGLLCGLRVGGGRVGRRSGKTQKMRGRDRARRREATMPRAEGASWQLRARPLMGPQGSHRCSSEVDPRGRRAEGHAVLYGNHSRDVWGKAEGAGSLG